MAWQRVSGRTISRRHIGRQRCFELGPSGLTATTSSTRPCRLADISNRAGDAKWGKMCSTVTPRLRRCVSGCRSGCKPHLLLRGFARGKGLRFFFFSDLHLLLLDIESQVVVDAHVLIGDPDQSEEGDQISAPIGIQEMEASDEDE